MCLRLIAETDARSGGASCTLCDPVTLTLIGGRGIVMDYLCTKFGDFSFSRFGFIVRTDRQTESQRWMIAILKRQPYRRE